MSNPLNLLLPSDQDRPDRWRWGTIWSLDPLRVRLDGDTEPLNGTPSRLVTYLAIGSRVYVHVRQGRTPVIVGVSGGDNRENQAPTAHSASLERADLTVPNASIVRIASFTEDTQHGTYLSPTSSRIRVERSGMIEAVAAMRWAGNSSGRRQVRIYLDDVQYGYIEDTPGHTGWFGQNVSTGAIFAETGQQVDVRVYQDSGGTLNGETFSEGNYNTNYLRVHWLGK